VFDIGFSELLLIAVVALVVLGPERLPKAARFAGLWVRRARSQWDSVKQELERELEAEELKRNLHSVRQSLRDAETQLRHGEQQVRAEGQRLNEEISRDVDVRGIESRDIDIRTGSDVPATAASPVEGVADDALPVADVPGTPVHEAGPKADPEPRS